MLRKWRLAVHQVSKHTKSTHLLKASQFFVLIWRFSSIADFPEANSDLPCTFRCNVRHRTVAERNISEAIDPRAITGNFIIQ